MKPHPMNSRGFVFTFTAIIIVLALAASFMAAQTLPFALSGARTQDPRVEAQARASLAENALIVASKGGNVSQYLAAVSSLFPLIGNVSSEVVVFQPSAPLPPGAIVKTSNGTGTGPVTVYAPQGYTIAISSYDQASGIIALLAYGTVQQGAQSVALSIPGNLPSGLITVYEPMGTNTWSYSGTVNTTLKYSVRLDSPIITTESWTPPPGVSQIFIYGAPPLSLAQLAVGGTERASVADHQTTTISTSGLTLPASGTITVRTATSWLFTSITRGDAFSFNP